MTTINRRYGTNARKKRIISVDRVIVAQNPKKERDLEYFGSFSIKKLKYVM
jgi:hypothetical protein